MNQINVAPERADEQYKKQIIDAEKKAKKATIFSYIALGLWVVTLVAAGALAVMAYGAKTEIIKLIELVSALEQGMGDGAIKSFAKEENKAPEVAGEQGVADKALEIEQTKSNGLEKKDSAEKPVAETAKTETVSEAQTVKPEAEAAKVEAVTEEKAVKPEAAPAKAGAKHEAEAEKAKAGIAKAGAVTETETANPEADTVKSAAVLKAALDKAVAASKTAAAKKTIAKKETVKNKPVKSTTKAAAPVNWTVQLAAYKQEWFAKSKAAEFKQKGVPVEVVAGDVNNTAWYRLRVRGFSNKGEAASYAARIKKALNLSSVSVSDN